MHSVSGPGRFNFGKTLGDRAWIVASVQALGHQQVEGFLPLNKKQMILPSCER